MRIHERVRAARVAARRSVAEVARAAGVDFAHLYRFERGQRQMTSDRLESVLKALGLEIQHHDHPPGSGNYETCPGDIATSEEEQPGEPVEGAA